MRHEWKRQASLRVSQRCNDKIPLLLCRILCIQSKKLLRLNFVFEYFECELKQDRNQTGFMTMTDNFNLLSMLNFGKVVEKLLMDCLFYDNFSYMFGAHTIS